MGLYGVLDGRAGGREQSLTRKFPGDVCIYGEKMEGPFISGFTILVSFFFLSFFLLATCWKDKMTRKNVVKDSKSGHLSLKRRIDVLVFFFIFSVGPHMKHAAYGHPLLWNFCSGYS